MSAVTPTTNPNDANRVPGYSSGRWSWAGVLFVVLFLGSLVVSAAAGSGSFPSPFGDGPEIHRYFTDNHDAVVLLSVFQAFAAVVLVMFTAGSAAFARRATGDPSPLPDLVVLGGGTAAGFLLLTALLEWTLVRSHVTADLTSVRLLQDLAFLAGGPAHVAGMGLLIGSMSVAARGRIPRWLSGLGLVVSTLSVASLLTLVAEPAVFLVPVGRFLGFVWILIAAFVLRRP